MNAAANDYIAEAIAEGFFFECGCGEHYDTVAAAASCRKCRSYSPFGWCTHVTDLRTGDVVWGEKPSQEEYDAAAADMLAEDIREEYWADLDEKEAAQVKEEEWEVYEAKAEAEGY